MEAQRESSEYGAQRLDLLRETYRHFLTFKENTRVPEIYQEQDKIYQEIFNAPDPERAADEFYQNGKTTFRLACERLGIGY